MLKAVIKLKISAGSELSVLRPKPLITINGKNVFLRQTGVAYYAFKVSENQERHYIPVKIMFIDQR
jgi:hypothetical protein